LAQIKAAAHRHNVGLGMYCSDGKAAAQRVQEGFTMLSITSDAVCLMAAADENLKQARVQN